MAQYTIYKCEGCGYTSEEKYPNTDYVSLTNEKRSFFLKEAKLLVARHKTDCKDFWKKKNEFINPIYHNWAKSWCDKRVDVWLIGIKAQVVCCYSNNEYVKDHTIHGDIVPYVRSLRISAKADPIFQNDDIIIMVRCFVSIRININKSVIKVLTDEDKEQFRNDIERFMNFREN